MSMTKPSVCQVGECEVTSKGLGAPGQKSGDLLCSLLLCCWPVCTLLWASSRRVHWAETNILEGPFYSGTLQPEESYGNHDRLKTKVTQDRQAKEHGRGSKDRGMRKGPGTLGGAELCRAGQARCVEILPGDPGTVE